MALPAEYRGSTPGDAAEGAGSIRRHAVSRKPAGRQSSIAPRLIKSNCARVLTILKSRLYK